MRDLKVTSLTDREQEAFDEQGYVVVSDCLGAAEIDILRTQLPAVLADDSPRRVLERDGRTVRAVHGVHATNDVFSRLVRHPRLIGPAQRILDDDVYVHQFKINVKSAFEGDIWKWHQDFIFWLKQDGMREPRCVNAMLYLNDVTEFNGPLYVVPGSHREGVVDVNAAGDGRGWQASVSADLKYAIPQSRLADMVERKGLDAPKGRAGSVLFTHSNLVHGSPPNMSPFDRTLVIITYNSVKNALDPVPNPRPEFLISRDFTPLTALGDDALLGLATSAAMATS